MKSVLIANRGEIAMRIIRTCKEEGIRSIVAFSEADRFSPAVNFADDSICLGGAPAAESYLAIDKIIAAAKQTGAQAIHPGYGFLSENEDFAKRCDTPGLRVSLRKPRFRSSRSQSRTDIHWSDSVCYGRSWR